MNKQERLGVIKRMKPQTWYMFSLFEALHGEEVQISKAKLAVVLGITVPTLSKYLNIWKGFNLIKEIPGGFVISQLDGQESGVTSEVKEREFNTPRDIIDYWCKTYFEEYGETYNVSNWGMANSQVKKLLMYSDHEIKGTIKYVITKYSSKWASAKYPRPTLGALGSWLFRSALPFVEKETIEQTTDYDSGSLLEDLEGKGWI